MPKHRDGGAGSPFADRSSGPQDGGRRTTLRRLAGGLVLAAGPLVPERWTKPLIETVVAPAFATVATTTPRSRPAPPVTLPDPPRRPGPPTTPARPPTAR